MKKVYVLYRATGESGDDGDPYEEVIYGVFSSKKKVEEAKKQAIIIDEPRAGEPYRFSHFECDYYEFELNKLHTEQNYT